MKLRAALLFLLVLGGTAAAQSSRPLKVTDGGLNTCYPVYTLTCTTVTCGSGTATCSGGGGGGGGITALQATAGGGLVATPTTIVSTGSFGIATGGVTNAMLAGSIANAKLQNSSVTINCGSELTGCNTVALGNSLTIDIATGGVTNAMLAGSIANNKLANSTIGLTTSAGTGLNITGAPAALGGAINVDTDNTILAFLAGAQTFTGVKTFAVSADPIFAAGGTHTVIVATPAAASTAGNSLVVRAGAGSDSSGSATGGAGAGNLFAGGAGGAGSGSFAGGAGGGGNYNGGTGGAGTASAVSGAGGSAILLGGSAGTNNGGGAGSSGFATVSGGIGVAGSGSSPGNTGGIANFVSGAGGAGTASATSGTGGSATIRTGSGGTNNGGGGGNGGALTISTGSGPAGNGSSAGANGGQLSIGSGNGGAGTASAAAGTAGPIPIQPGSGGASGGFSAGAAGALLSMAGGNGGNGSGAQAAGVGGTTSISGGSGGTGGASSAAGDGGPLLLYGGPAGSGSGAGTGASGGGIVMRGGVNNGTGGHLGDIDIGSDQLYTRNVTVGNATGNVRLPKFAAAGVVYNDSSGNLASISMGTNGQCLQSQGAGLAPAWGACSGGGGSVSVTSSTLTVNPSPGTTTFTIDVPTAGLVVSGGVTTPSIDRANAGALTLGGANATSIGLQQNLSIPSGKTATFGSNALISGDKLQAQYLSIASQATGDLLYASSASAFSRLAIGTAGQCLLVSGGVPAWGSCGGGGAVSVTSSTLTVNPSPGTTTFTVDTPAGGLLAVNGGTGKTSYTVGDILYANTTTTLAALADVASGHFLRSGGVSTAPAWSTTTYPNAATTGDLLYASGTNVYASLGIGTSGQCLKVSGGIPSWGTCIAANSLLTLGTGLGGTSYDGSAPVTATVLYGTTSGTAVVGNDARMLPTPSGAGKVPYDTGAAYAVVAAGTVGQCFISNGAAAPSWGPCTASANAIQLQGVDISNAAPSNRDVLTYNGGTAKWEPAAPTIPVASGGGKVLYDNGASAYAETAAGTSGQAFLSGGTGSPTWGTLGGGAGGTGQTTYTAGDMLYATGATTLSKLGVGTNGQCLVVTTGAPAWGSCGAGGSNATQIQGRNVASTAPSDKDALCWNATNVDWEPCATPSGTSSQVLIGGTTPSYTGSPSITAITLSSSVSTPAVDRANAGTLTFGGTNATGIALQQNVTMPTGKTVTVGSNALISGDKLQASLLAIASQATGDLLYATSATAFGRLGIGTAAQCLVVSGGIPAWGSCAGGLPDPVTVAHGGTGLTTLTAHALYVGNGASNPTALTVGSTNQVLLGSTGADPAFGSLPVAALPAVKFSTAKDFNAAICQNGTAYIGETFGSANAPTAVCFGDATAANPYQGAAEFTATGQLLQGQLRLPTDWVTGSGNNMIVKFRSVGTTGNVVWKLETKCEADSAVAPTTWNTGQTVSVAAKGTTLQFNTATLSTITTTGCTAGDVLLFKLSLDATTTTTGNEDLTVVSFELMRSVTFQ